MDITTRSGFLPHTAPDASPAFCRDVRDCAFRDPAGNMIRIQEPA